MTRAAVLAAVATTTLRRPERTVTPTLTALACGTCDEIVTLADLRWRNRRALLLGCRFCTPKEDQWS